MKQLDRLIIQLNFHNLFLNRPFNVEIHLILFALLFLYIKTFPCYKKIYKSINGRFDSAMPPELPFSIVMSVFFVGFCIIVKDKTLSIVFSILILDLK